MSPLLPCHTSRARFAIICVAVVLLASYFNYRLPHHSSLTLGLSTSTESLLASGHTPAPYCPTHKRKKEGKVNDTLDFGDIYAINLPHRHDRRDILTVMAGLSHLKITFIDGVLLKSHNYARKGFAPHARDTPLSKLGCFRAHANVWRRIVSGTSETALVLEDDVDWDVHLKDIVESLQGPLQSLTTSLVKDEHRIRQMHERSKYSNSKWNEKQWDILRLGTCADPAHKLESKAVGVNPDKPPYIMYEDYHVSMKDWIARDHQSTLLDYGVPMETHSDSGQRFRIIQQSNYPVCMHAYAVTRLGAAKLLHLVGQGLIDGANDLTVARLTQEGSLRSFTVIPSIFSQWKIDKWDGNSDNTPIPYLNFRDRVGMYLSGPKAKYTAYSWDINRSLRAELGDLLNTSESL